MDHQDGGVFGQVPRLMAPHPRDLRGRAIGALDPMRAGIDDEKPARRRAADQRNIGGNDLAIGSRLRMWVGMQLGPRGLGRFQKFGAHRRIV